MNPADLLSPDSYPTLFVACVLSGWLIPVPEDVVLLWAGLRIGEGVFAWAPTLLVSTAGVGLRDLLAWGFGRLGGHLLETGWLSRLVSAKNVARARTWVVRHGNVAVFAGRFMVGFRVPVFVAAGAAGVPLRSFAWVDGLGLLIAVPVTIALGERYGVAFVELAHRLVTGSTVFWTLVAAAAVWSFTWARGKARDRAA